MNELKEKYKEKHGQAEGPGSGNVEAASSSSHPPTEQKPAKDEANKEQPADSSDKKSAKMSKETSASDSKAAKKQKNKETSASDSKAAKKQVSKETSASDSKAAKKQASKETSESDSKAAKQSLSINGFKAKTQEQFQKLKQFSKKKSNSVELLDDDCDEAQPTEAPHEGSSSSASAPVALAPGAASSQKANIEVDGKDKTRIKTIFDPVSDYKKEASERKTKDLYLQADLIFPGIALKKMKQAMSAHDATPENYIAILGEHTLNMHRTPKAGVQKMVLADYVKYQDTFWPRVSQHLGTNSISVLIAASNFPVPFDEVAEPQKLDEIFQNRIA